jgi:hypothetical protein
MIQKYIGRLNAGIKISAAYYLRLGILTHYIADAFTFPHNEQFEGDLREHIKYEQILHEKINMENCFQGFYFCRENRKSTTEMIENFIRMHQAYINGWNSPGDDLLYMRQGTQEIICAHSNCLRKKN